MDRDYIWEGEYGRRSHLIPVFQQLLREPGRLLAPDALPVRQQQSLQSGIFHRSELRPPQGGASGPGCSVFWRTLDCGSGRT